MTRNGPPKIFAVVLAAGRSTRMGDINKLLVTWQGKPLVAHVVDAAVGCSELSQVAVVTGHQSQAVTAVLGEVVTTVHNPHYATGMASSLKTAVEWSKQHNADGVLVLLGDMPLVRSFDIEKMLATFAKANQDAIIQATNQGQPGNPVLLPASLFAELMHVDGDRGARSVIELHGHQVIPVDIGTAAARDFDTPQAFSQKDD